MKNFLNYLNTEVSERIGQVSDFVKKINLATILSVATVLSCNDPGSITAKDSSENELDSNKYESVGMIVSTSSYGKDRTTVEPKESDLFVYFPENTTSIVLTNTQDRSEQYSIPLEAKNGLFSGHIINDSPELIGKTFTTHIELQSGEKATSCENLKKFSSESENVDSFSTKCYSTFSLYNGYPKNPTPLKR